MLAPLQWLATLALVMAAWSRVEASQIRQHDVVPEHELVAEITHVALAFMRPGTFNVPEQDQWPLFTTVAKVRPKFARGTGIQVAIGGWGDTDGFSIAAETEESRKMFANNIKIMLETTGADGVDIDWEYPGGNGEDYKSHPNSEKAWEIDAYPELLAEIRRSIGPDKTISAAVPGLPRDMLAFTNITIPKIKESVDFFNIMTYDLMNRRDNVTKHHTGLQASLEGINTYLERGVPPENVNIGLAFYVKWYKTAPDTNCHDKPIGCKTALMEDPVTGADLGQAAGFSWHDEVPLEVAVSWGRAKANGVYDPAGGGHYYWDEQERLFWSWDTPEAIELKLRNVVKQHGLGGVFAWGLGEDAPKFEHLRAANEVMKDLTLEESADDFEKRCEV